MKSKTQFFSLFYEKVAHKYLKYFFVIHLTVFALSLFAQNENKPDYFKHTPPMPEAQSLISQINARNNYHTGAVNTSVPLFTVQGDMLEHPISASYVSNGIKVEDEASRIGLGWNLNAGGRITRVVRGINDEHLSTILVDEFVTPIPQSVLFIQDYVYLMVKGYLQNFENPPEEIIEPGLIHHNYWYYYYDELPDLFYYDVGGLSGKFTLNQDGTVNQLPYNNVEITYERGNDNSSFDNPLNTGTDIDNDQIISFTIKDENGRIFTFEDIELSTTIEWSPPDDTEYNFPVNIFNEFVSSWNISKIEHVANCETIDFSYDPVLNIFPNYKSVNHKLVGNGVTNDCECKQTQSSFTDNVGANGTTKRYNSLILKEIDWRHGKIEFQYADREDLTGDKHYTQMDIYVKDETNVSKSYKFLTSYFEADGIPGTLEDVQYKRLKLDGIRELGTNGLSNGVPDYVFQYEESVNLPHKDSKERDIWGYYNGLGAQPVPNLGIPQIYVNNVSLGKDRISTINFAGGGSSTSITHVPSAKANILTKITRPTGGHTTFDYEAHKFKYKGDVTSGGGLRLLSMKTNDDNGNETEYEYAYIDDDGLTSGYATGVPAYGHLCYQPANPNNTNEILNAVYSSSSRLDYPLGNEIGYRRVREFNPSGGYTEFRFTSANEYPDEDVNTVHNTANTGINCTASFLGQYDHYPYVTKTSFDYKRGLMLSSKTYSGSTVLSSVNNVYNFNNVNTTNLTQNMNVFAGNSFSGLIESSKSIHSEFVYLDEKTETKDGVSQTTDYIYDLTNYKLRSEESFIDGKNYSTHYTYSYDYNTPEHLTLVTQRRIELIEQLQKVDGVIVDGMKYNYLESGTCDGTTTPDDPTPDGPLPTINRNTNAVAISNTLGPFISSQDRYEVTWSSNGTRISSGWQNQVTFTSYNIHAKPERVTFDGNPHDNVLTYSATGKVLTENYGNFTKSYVYTGKDLLQSVTDIDGQITTFNYDNMQRLDYSYQRGTKIYTNLTYNYNAENYVTTQTNFYQQNGQAIEVSQIDKQSFDGLGRPIMLTKIAYSDDAQDVVSQTIYNNDGLKDKDIDPLNGEVIYDYYNDPLNRIKTITDPMGFVTSKTYGANISGEVSGFNSNTLYKETTTDPDGISSSTFTDRLGRVVMTMTKQGTNVSKTLTVYDDKGRVKTIIPPGATTATGGLIYKYEYDGADNVLKTKIPDKQWMNFRYDDRNLQIAMNDGNIRAKSKGWLNSEFDNYGRLFKQGFGQTPGEVTELLIQQFYDNRNAQNSVNNSTPIYKGKMHRKQVNVLDGFDKSFTIISTNYALDDYGRVEQETITNHLGNTETKSYTYNMADQILTSTHVHDGNTTVATNEYDNKGRFEKAFYKVNGVNKKISEITDYSLKDEVLSKTMGNQAQIVDFAYNANGWLTTINNGLTAGTAGPPICCPPGQACPEVTPGDVRVGPNADLFALDIRYQNPDHGNPRENGNIAEIHWQVLGKQKEYYNFTYDFLNRLKTATNLDDKYNTAYSYDARGNITSLQRNGLIAGANCFTKQSIDNLTYTYTQNTNKLKHISDGVTTQACPTNHHQGNVTNQNGSYGANNRFTSDAALPIGGNITFSAGGHVLLEPGFCGNPNFQAVLEGCPTPNLANNELGVLPLSDSYGYTAYSGTTTYEYDTNGNLKTDNAKGLSIQYNHLNLPFEVQKDANNKIEWLYTAEGEKLQKLSIQNGTSSQKDYLGDMELHNEKLQIAKHNEGRYVVEGNDWEYNLKDHLGNVRVVFTTALNDAQGQPDFVSIVQENHYYPFGMQMNGNFIKKQSVKNDYLYNGKEMNTEIGLNWSDYGARFYDPVVCRFTGVDPISGQFANLSTYNYASNDPILNIDLWGLQGLSINYPTNEGAGAGVISNPHFPDAGTFYVENPVAYNNYLSTRQANASDVAEGLSFIVGIGAIGATFFTPGPEDAFLAGASKLGGAFLKSVSKFADDAVDGVKGLFRGGDKVNNPVPGEVARVVEAKFKDSPTLGAPGAEDVFVTAADDIKNVTNSADLAKKLTLKNEDGSMVKGPFQVTTFKTPKNGIASPVNRDNPGFEGNGRTAGGAREFTIPNQEIPANANKEIID